MKTFISVTYLLATISFFLLFFSRLKNVCAHEHFLFFSE